ncbi:biotin--[acetyl-CoA-carboxylase] ligase [Pseudonocardia asaccharolytica]|uniref:biotin--[biotin carboxyl-carrier protein] ligase n=1 Tax=Pseudonocardia asaccharolytica DSM 44247 = NBRC 16224 TaxID=1123024 RepID=A0A511D4J4_9PSEU|nr:biotin--[acetyl-CoA-carboxylase] ligase [Pseudonocardia asaccharolytica]GEL19716.1 biotin--[acetyl-CoA-carboxylase] ligase [Pseudonocardia asaccharolytica DSM 44247 = NBRC 16224]
MSSHASPLDADRLRSTLLAPVGPWASLDLVEQTGSTNADLLAAAAAGAPDRSALAAEHQVAGRGRLTRTWESPAGSGITVSVLWRPTRVPADRLGWLPMLGGLALLDTVREFCPAPAGLKWPNDLLLGPDQRKAAGVLAEMTAVTGGGPGVVLGIGLNVGARRARLPEGATSLAEEGATDVDRTDLLIALLTRLADREARWRESGGDAEATGLHADYRAACISLGMQVRVELPGGESLVGMAEDIDSHGRLLLLGPDGARRPVAAGDVVHLRPASG